MSKVSTQLVSFLAALYHLGHIKSVKFAFITKKVTQLDTFLNKLFSRQLLQMLVGKTVYEFLYEDEGSKTSCPPPFHFSNFKIIAEKFMS